MCKEEVVSDEDNCERILCEAMIRAKEEFYRYIRVETEIDEIFFELNLIGYELDINLERLDQVIIKTPETKDVKECECGRNEKVYNM